LDESWMDPQLHIAVIVAIGGAGKSTLCARWAAGLLSRSEHSGVERYFDWSFYNQGRGANTMSSADPFLDAALRFFEDPDMASSNASSWEKAERLADLVSSRRTLLILDGVEPLQAPPVHAGSGALKDDAMRALLGKLVVHNRGLCLITTRTRIQDLVQWEGRTAWQWELDSLTDAAGAEILWRHGVKGPAVERELASRAVKGHALTLSLMGKYIRMAFPDDPDIARRDCFDLKAADDQVQGGHAFRVIAAYERWLKAESEHVELSILRFLGLFDRPASPDCMSVLRKSGIRSLSDRLGDLSDARWNIAISRLRELGLVETIPWKTARIAGYDEATARQAMTAGLAGEDFMLGEPQIFLAQKPMTRGSSDSLDTHPLIRDYFSHRLDSPVAKAAHDVLFDYLRSSVPYWPEGTDGLHVLYQAISHGCQAGRHQEAYDAVFDDRVQRGTSGPHAYYSRTRFALINADLAALANFFVEPWISIHASLRSDTQENLLAETAFRLRVSMRLREAEVLLQQGLQLAEQNENWLLLAHFTCTVSEVKLLLGDVSAAVEAAESAVSYAERSGDLRQRVVRRATLADALHQSGRTEDSEALFAEAEKLSAGDSAMPRLLDGLRSAHYCDVLLGTNEHLAWRIFLNRHSRCNFESTSTWSEARQRLDDAKNRATLTLQTAVRHSALLDSALDHLTLGRIQLYRWHLEMNDLVAVEAAREDAELALAGAVTGAHHELNTSIRILRRAARYDYLPAALLSRAWLHALVDETSEAQTVLDEAQALAERGQMLVHLIDVHLHRARLFRHGQELQRARALVMQCHYLRRIPELEDAEQAARAW
jgi:hypothetical protein